MGERVNGGADGGLVSTRHGTDGANEANGWLKLQAGDSGIIGVCPVGTGMKT